MSNATRTTLPESPARSTLTQYRLGMISRVLAAIAATVALLGATTTQADAKEIRQTVRVKPAEHNAGPPAVMVAKYVYVRDGSQRHKMVRFRLNNHSVWLSPSAECLGPRHYSCVVAWEKAAKRAAFLAKK